MDFVELYEIFFRGWYYIEVWDEEDGNLFGICICFFVFNLC